MSQPKIDPNLQDRISNASVDSPMAVIVRHKGQKFFSQAMGDVTGFTLLNATAMKIQARHINTLAEDDTVEYIWADLPVHTCLDVSVPHLGVPSVWTAGFTGKGVKLAIVDTGIDPTHADFSGRIVSQTNIAGGLDKDENGHGTHVAGIAAGTGVTSGGKYRGVAPGAQLYIAKVLDKNGGGTMSGVMAGIEWAVNQGVQVINLSLGSSGSGDGTDALSAMCDAAVEKGIVMCVAAGNEGPGSATIGSPGCARLVTTIGASNDTDGIAGFSSRGPTADGRVKPDLVFPGYGIVAPQAAGTQLGQVVVTGYISLDGTSMATPHASGTVCLLLQANPKLTPVQVKEALRNTALDLKLAANTQGSGRAQVLKAFQQVAGTPAPVTPTPTPITPTPTNPPTENKGCFPETLAKLFNWK